MSNMRRLTEKLKALWSGSIFQDGTLAWVIDFDAAAAAVGTRMVVSAQTSSGLPPTSLVCGPGRSARRADPLPEAFVIVFQTCLGESSSSLAIDRVLKMQMPVQTILV